MKYKLTAGLDVRTGPNEIRNDGEGNEYIYTPTRRIGEAGDVIDISDVPEWGNAPSQWLLDDGLLIPVTDQPQEVAEPEMHDDEVL